MKTFFSDEEVGKAKSKGTEGVVQGKNEAVKRIKQYLFPLLDEAKFRIEENVQLDRTLGEMGEKNDTEDRFRKKETGLLCEIFHPDDISRSLLVQVAVRMVQIDRTDTGDYPRFHMPSNIYTKHELYQLLKYHNVHFCVLTVEKNKGTPAYFGFDSFASISEDKYKLVSRGKRPSGRRRKEDRLIYPSKIEPMPRVGRKGEHLKDTIYNAIMTKGTVCK